jgi:hypothetical protein
MPNRYGYPHEIRERAVMHRVTVSPTRGRSRSPASRLPETCAAPPSVSGYAPGGR